jgi:hypothetical protein
MRSASDADFSTVGNGQRPLPSSPFLISVASLRVVGNPLPAFGHPPPQAGEGRFIALTRLYLPPAPSLISVAALRMVGSPLPAFGHPLARQAGEGRSIAPTTLYLPCNGTPLPQSQPPAHPPHYCKAPAVPSPACGHRHLHTVFPLVMLIQNACSLFCVHTTSRAVLSKYCAN